MKFRILFALLLSFGMLLPLSAQTIEQKGDIQFLSHTLILKVKPEYRSYCHLNHIQQPVFQAIEQEIGILSTKKIFPQHQAPIRTHDEAGQKLVDLSLIYEIRYEADISPFQLAQKLSSLDLFVYAEPWYVYELAYMPNDPLADTTGGTDVQWYLTLLQAREAWDIETGDSTIVVGVTDTGISFQHPDLQDNVATNDADPIDGVDNDGDGYTDNYRGWDMAGYDLSSDDNDPTYVHSHGVSVTGLFAATADNGIGTAGLAFNCAHLPVKVAPDLYPSSITHGYQGIVYAVDAGAQIVNCSWGGSASGEFGQDAIRYATINRQAAVIAACGNTNSDIAFYPAAYPEVLSVANTNKFDARYANSTYGYTVDVSAPGAFVHGPAQHSNYASVTGTSFASPITAGVVALTLKHFPSLSPVQAAQRVRVTTDDIYSLNPNFIDQLGSGRVNLLKALSEPNLPSIRIASDSVQNQAASTSSFQSGDTLSLYFDFINYLEPTQNLQISLSAPGQSAYIQLLDSSFTLGSLATLTMENNYAQPFRIIIQPNTPYDYEAQIKLTFQDTSSNYQDYEYITIPLNPSYIDINHNRIHTTINSIGNWGYHDFPDNQYGQGFRLDTLESALFEGGFLVGSSDGRVSNNIRNPFNTKATSWGISEAVEETQQTPYFHAQASYQDSLDNGPIDVGVEQNIYASDDSLRDDFIISEFIITNESQDILPELYAGLFADWDVGNYLENACTYDSVRKMVYAYDQSDPSSFYYGMALLSDGPFKAYATFNGGMTFNDAGKLAALSNEPSATTASTGTTNGLDIMHFISEGSFCLYPNHSRKVAFAMLAGESLADLQTAVEEARNYYRCMLVPAPVAGFALADSLESTDKSIHFHPDGVLADSIHWDFGDGNSSHESDPSHIYTQAGNYNICQEVFLCGDSAISCENLEIIECGKDVFEPNDALVYASPLPIVGVMQNARICSSSDVDWYEFELNSEQPNIRILLSDLPADYDVELWDDAGSMMSSSTESGTNQEVLIANMLDVGTYYLRVFGKQDAWDAAEGYRLIVQPRNTPYTSSLSMSRDNSVTDVEEVADDFIRVYPNPASSRLFVESSRPFEAVQWSLCDLQGRKVLTGSLPKGSTDVQIELPKLEAGLYYVMIAHERKILMIK